MSGSPARIKNERIRLARAAVLVGCSRRWMWRLVAAGVLTNATPPAERGPRRPAFVWADEVEVLRTQGRAACKDYRLDKGRA